MNLAILSRGPQLYSTQRLYRAAKQRGHYVEVIDHTRCNLVLEQGCVGVYYEDRPLERLDAIIPRIGSSVTSQGASVISQFELMGVFTSASAQALLQTRDKLRCLQRLAGHGVDVPRTVFVGDEEELASLIHRVGGPPVVIKLLESTHGAGVLLAHTHQNAESTVEAFRRLRERVIIQEFIAEAKGADIRALVIAGRVVAVMRRQAPNGEFRSNLHRGGTSAPERLTYQEEQAVVKAVEAVGLDVAGVDLLRSRRGPLIMEVNASPGLEGIENTTGINVSMQIIRFVERSVRARKRDGRDAR